ncbi:SusC/RagA family TonB-linked outer membrane protein [Mariniflexile litorale]|uniref:SusC/RagA family TonB-linked outer membrane protein n=1 Tax=Mariniflexile litorale TaxID=3045158 RepID=A0AAU7EEB0_9FLAO|nr:SusC/RagA family TonB-linked outer membrane protein [Mariniflexile sp. KMM 9835]MDQ8212892.1 SusC/RagA family TonB-linked outer membrane protein [Mariniflexile sp. KMM 9835]
MKKLLSTKGRHHIILPKFNLKMKISLFLFIVTFFQLQAETSYSQKTKIDLNFKETSLFEIIKVIENKTEFKFFYSKNELDLDRKINIQVKQQLITKILNSLFTDGSINYKVIDKQIILTTNKQKKETSANDVIIQDQIKITGTITDKEGIPLAGTNILEKGTANGVVTDFNGSYSINVSNKNAILVFFYLGMKTEEISVGNQLQIDVVLEEDLLGLGEVVVVGYGTQKKINLTGSVDNVSGKVLTTRPQTNSSNLLQGRLTGVNVTQPGAEPGLDSPNIRIRGFGSYGASNDPLILIDGVSGSLNNLSPADIETVTVLKDASSAAIYGARAANGVILVTTKRGKKGAPVINFSTNISIQSPTRLPDFITNSVEYMEMLNTASANDGKPIPYTQANIDAYRNAPAGSKEYPNFDALDYWFQNATVKNHNLSVAGGGESNTYNVSFGYLDQNSMIPGYKFTRYNGLINNDLELSKWVTLGTTINLTSKYTGQPSANSLFTPMYIYTASPLNEPYLPDGSGRPVTRAYASEASFRPRPGLQESFIMGEQYYKETNINPQIYVDIKPFKGLTWTTKAAINYVDVFYKMHQQNYTAYSLHERDPITGDYLAIPKNADVLGVTDDYSKDITKTFYSVATYQNTFAENHDFSVLGGYEQNSFRHQQLRATRPNSVNPALTELQAYTATNQELFKQTTRMLGYNAPYEWGLQSLFGRVNYSFKNKYLFEGNIRYDGTSKVSPDYRWGVFPSASVGWVVSEEKFIKDKLSWLNSFKLRGSYGILGNSDIGAYAYQDNLDITVSYPFGSTLTQGAVVNTFKDQSLRWETTRITDIGFDLNIKNGLLGATFDWFDKYTYDILAKQPIPVSMGLSDPTLNDGKMRNRGFELNLTHRNQIGELNYDTYFQISKFKNEVVHISAPSIGNTIRADGSPYNEMNLYIWDGIVQESDLTDPNFPTSTLNPNPKAGDLKMKDVSGPNGVPDGIINGDDRQPVSGLYPKFSYAFGFNFDYKQFNLNLFFQGVEGQKSVMSFWGPQPFAGGMPPMPKWRNAWTPQNPTNKLPALHTDGYAGVNSYSNSTYFLQDGSYLRLKSVMLSYTLPASFIKNIKAKDCVVYVSGDNLLTFTKFEGQDPERSLTSYQNVYLSYPQARIINFGLNVKF